MSTSTVANDTIAGQGGSSVRVTMPSITVMRLASEQSAETSVRALRRASAVIRRPRRRPWRRSAGDCSTQDQAEID